jgi:hypothetical protein
VNKLLFFLFVLISTHLSAQEKGRDSLYAKSPLWIAMMEDTATNYNDAIKAFDIYFKYHTMPEEPEEVAHERLKEGKEKEILPIKNLTKEELAEKEQEYELALQIKRFKRWKKDVFPYVQEDGRILSPEEQIRLWEQNTGRKAKQQ